MVLLYSGMVIFHCPGKAQLTRPSFCRNRLHICNIHWDSSRAWRLAADVSNGGSNRRIGNFYQKSLLSIRSFSLRRQRNKAAWCFKVLILGWSLEIVQ